jgi:predicted nucleic acid-binding protein
MEDNSQKSSWIFDTSPLITTCTGHQSNEMLIHHLMQHITIIVVETVAQEATSSLRHADARMIRQLLDAREIHAKAVPQTRMDHFIEAYPKLGNNKGKGERDTIKLGVHNPESRVVIDDQQAYFVAARFDLRPITLLDLMVDFVRLQLWSAHTAARFLTQLEGRYTKVALQLTQFKIHEADVQ